MSARGSRLGVGFLVSSVQPRPKPIGASGSQILGDVKTGFAWLGRIGWPTSKQALRVKDGRVDEILIRQIE